MLNDIMFHLEEWARWLVLSFVSLLISCSVSAAAHNPLGFNSVYFFGDSLTDAGSIAGIRFTTLNGKVWSQYFAEYIGVPPNSAYDFSSPGNNYAVAGENLWEMNRHLTDHLKKTGPLLSADTLYVLWGGGNNLLHALTKAKLQPEHALSILKEGFDKVVHDFESLLERFLSKGAKHLLMLSMPDLAESSLAGTYGEDAFKAIVALSKWFNERLRTMARTYSDQGSIYFIDTATLQHEFIHDPNSGLKETELPACRNNVFECTSISDLVEPSASETYFFADIIHPTSAIHKILAQTIIDTFEALVDYSRAPHSIVSALRQDGYLSWHEHFSQLPLLTSWQLAPVFLKLKFNPQFHLNSSASHVNGIDLSVPLMKNEDRSLWARVSYQGRSHLISPLLSVGYKGSELEFLLDQRGRYAHHHAAVGVAYLDVKDIIRGMYIGKVSRLHHASTSAISVYGALGSQTKILDAPFWHWTIGGRVSGQHFHMNSFREKESYSTALRLEDMSYSNAAFSWWSELRYRINQSNHSPFDIFLRVTHEPLLWHTNIHALDAGFSLIGSRFSLPINVSSAMDVLTTSWPVFSGSIRREINGFNGEKQAWQFSLQSQRQDSGDWNSALEVSWAF